MLRTFLKRKFCAVQLDIREQDCILVLQMHGFIFAVKTIKICGKTMNLENRAETNKMVNFPGNGLFITLIALMGTPVKRHELIS